MRSQFPARVHRYRTIIVEIDCGRKVGVRTVRALYWGRCLLVCPDLRVIKTFARRARSHVNAPASETATSPTTKFYSTSYTLQKCSCKHILRSDYPQLIGVPACMSSAGSDQGVPRYLPKTAVFYNLQHQGLAMCLTHGTERQPLQRHLASAEASSRKSLMGCAVIATNNNCCEWFTALVLINCE